MIISYGLYEDLELMERSGSSTGEDDEDFEEFIKRPIELQ